VGGRRLFVHTNIPTSFGCQELPATDIVMVVIFILDSMSNLQIKELVRRHNDDNQENVHIPSTLMPCDR
jgi:hypothetical protein